ncbi:bifunctional oligoribonuclease/PAP phosphatase NrnA [Chungangia koreensis]|uniref:Bifunctional oligoribonuclease/PAP phosphatase NrnA n=1 Tax=Chungangia koreensis TaxID=752657 RepID=A0ABV8X328_9LACT
MKRQIIDIISQFDTIIIHRHVRPDPDAYGSQIALKKLLEKNYPQKKVFAVGSHDVNLSYLAFPDQIDDGVYKGALVIVTDTANTERIDDERYMNGAKLIKIDHHPDDDKYGDIRWVDTSASSTSEMIYELFEVGKETERWLLPDEAARLLFAGIVGDTGRFLFSSTSIRTFEAAGDLIRYQFDRSELFKGMYEMPRNILHLLGYVFQQFEMDENGAAQIRLHKEILKEYDATSEQASLLVGSLGEVKGIKAWVVFIEEDDQIRVRLRSKGPVINGIAKEFGGGGHPLAAGASAESWEEADLVVKRIKEVCQNK